MSREDLHFRLRIPDDIKKKVEQSSSANQRSMTAEIISILRSHYDGSTEYRLRRIEERLDAMSPD